MAVRCQSWERGYAADIMLTQTRKFFWPGSNTNFLQPQKTKLCYLTFDQNGKFSSISSAFSDSVKCKKTVDWIVRHICSLGTTHTWKHTDIMKIHISKLESHMLIPPTQWNKLHRMQHTLLSNRDLQRMNAWNILKSSQHHWAEIKKRLVIPDECFIVDRFRRRSAVDRGQKTRSRTLRLKCFLVMYLEERRGHGLARRRKSGKTTNWIMSQFSSSCFNSCETLSEQVNPDRVRCDDPAFPTRLLILLRD